MDHANRQKASDFDAEVLRLFDKYVHGDIDRRAFLAGAARYAVGALGAAGLLAALQPRFAQAQQVATDDPRIVAEFVEIDSPRGHGKVRAYLAVPAKASGPIAPVLVIHENRGLNPHIEDVARRFALAGHAALAPDALFPLGGYPGDEDSARALFQKLDQARTREDFLAAARRHERFDGGTGRLGAVGFCWGGAMTNYLATQLPTLRAAAPFYGVAPALEDVPKIKAELLVVLAASDDRVNATWPAFRDALDAAKVRYALFQPPGTQHGFHNDTTPRYDETAARGAWERTLALFARNLHSTTGPG